MRTDAQFRQFALRALRQSDGNPLPDYTLRSSIRMAFPNVTLTDGDLGVIIRDLDREGFISGTTVLLTGDTVWFLTPKGVNAANQLP